MFDDKPYQDYVKQAEHHIAIGNTKIHLFGDRDEKPWEIATHCEPGSSHRLDISTSVQFTGKHLCGLTFTWSTDIEPRSASGSGSYQLDLEGIQRVLAKLTNQECRQQFVAYLLDCAVKIEKNADSYQQEATEKYGQASVLRSAARFDSARAEKVGV